MWDYDDQDRGHLYITISDNGAYLAAHGTPDGIVHAGSFMLDGRLFTFIDGWNCSPLPADTPGAYLLTLAGGGKWLYFDVYRDECPDRPAALRSKRWTRVQLTPTP